MILEDERRVPLAGVQARLRLAEQAWAGNATLASVVLTSQNGDALTARAIESVLAQTYPNFELLLVTESDDGLPGALSQRYPNLEVVEGSPGMAAARNAGLQASAGSAVVFLDSNERLLPNALERGLQELAAQPECAFVSGKCVVTREYHDDAEYPQQPLITSDHYAVLMGRNYVLTPGAAIFRRAALEAVGGFDETLEVFADYDLYLRLACDFEVGTDPEAVVETPPDDPLRGAGGNARRSTASSTRRKPVSPAIAVSRRRFGTAGTRGSGESGRPPRTRRLPSAPSISVTSAGSHQSAPTSASSGDGLSTDISSSHFWPTMPRTSEVMFSRSRRTTTR